MKKVFVLLVCFLCVLIAIIGTILYFNLILGDLPDQQGGYWKTDDGKSWFQVCEKHGTSLGEFFIDGNVYKAMYTFNSHHSMVGVIIYSNNDNIDCATFDSNELYKEYYGDSVFYKNKVVINFFNKDSNEFFKVIFTKDKTKESFSCDLDEEIFTKKNEEFFTEKIGTQGDGSPVS